MKLVYCLIAASLLSLTASAQDKEGKPEDGKRKKMNVSISTDRGLSIETTRTTDSSDKTSVYIDKDSIDKHKEKAFEFEFVAIDLVLIPSRTRPNMVPQLHKAF